MLEPLKPEDTLSIQQFADILGLPVNAAIAMLENSRGDANRSFYTFKMLAKRWNCSVPTIYRLLIGYKTFRLNQKGKSSGKQLVPRETVERIERLRTR